MKKPTRKPRKRRIKTSRDTDVFERFGGRSPAFAYVAENIDYEIADFVSNLPNAETEVHVVQWIKAKKGDKERLPIVARFTTAEGLKNHIEILIKHYHSAFENAEPIDPEGDEHQYESESRSDR